MRAVPKFAKIVLLAMWMTVAPTVVAFVPSEMRTTLRAWNLPNTIATTRIVSQVPSPSTALGYTNEVTVETEEQASEVNERVRDLTKPKPKPRMERRPANVQLVQTLSEYKAVVGDERERLTVVRFYADWCRVSDGPNSPKNWMQHLMCFLTFFSFSPHPPGLSSGGTFLLSHGPRLSRDQIH
jgi:hypothetical protein